MAEEATEGVVAAGVVGAIDARRRLSAGKDATAAVLYSSELRKPPRAAGNQTVARLDKSRYPIYQRPSYLRMRFRAKITSAGSRQNHPNVILLISTRHSSADEIPRKVKPARFVLRPGPRMLGSTTPALLIPTGT
jgi:hypothetical protein